MSSAETFELDSEDSEEQELQSSTFLRLLKLILKHRGPLFQGVAMILTGTFMVLMEPRIFGFAIDEAILPRRWDLLKRLGCLFFTVTCIRVFAAYRQALLFEILGQRVTQELRVMLFSHMQRLPVVVFDRNPAGRLLTRVTNDIAAINEMFSAGFVSMVCNILLVIGILVWLFILDPRLGLISSSVFPVMILVGIHFSRRLKIAYREARNKLSTLNAFLAENFSGMKIVHLFNRQGLHLKKFTRLNQNFAEAQAGSTRIFALFQPLITLAAGISVALTIWFGGLEVMGGYLKLGILVAYFSYILSLYQPIREIADKWNVFLSGMASAERVFSILDWPTESGNHKLEGVAQSIPNLKGHIVFENVWFAYQKENWVLRDFSLEIKPGEQIGIVGHTGAGKSSLISLLLRFYEPQKGRILLDGIDIREYDRRQLRASIGVVHQEAFLFSGSFEDNITFWDPAKREKMQAILKAVRASHIEGSKENESEAKTLDERGANLSMGEKQVIAFARVAATDPKVWVLDEATANMDSEQETHLQDALRKASSKRTGIFIAHRLATIQAMNRIAVLHKGCLVEYGNHDSLLKLNGLYARLYRYQASAQGVSVESEQGIRTEMTQ